MIINGWAAFWLGCALVLSLGLLFDFLKSVITLRTISRIVVELAKAGVNKGNQDEIRDMLEEVLK